VPVTDGICRVHGLADVMQGEMLEFPGNTFGMALNLERDSVGAVVLGEYELICGRRHGQVAPAASSRCRSVQSLLGRVVDALGHPIDGKGPINAKLERRRSRRSRRASSRASRCTQPVQTGLKAIDAMVPVGRGQRELIIGDRQTGKTAVAVDTIINQKGQPDVVSCIYVAVGQKRSIDRQRGAQARGARRHGTTPSSWPPPPPNPAPMQYHRAVSPAAPWASTSATAARTP
jgi:F-type H+-transporting ATPase subunit alpha